VKNIDIQVKMIFLFT